MSVLDTDSVCRFYDALVKDIVYMYPVVGDSLLEDVKILKRTILSRGIETVLVSLPEICSDLEYSLEIGWYKRRYSGPLSSTENGVPKFLRCLYLRVFSEKGVILEEPCHQAIRYLRQLLRCFKKYDIACPQSTKEKAIAAFIQIERELPTPNLSWGSRDLRINSDFPCLVDLVRRNLRRAEIRTRLSEIDRNWSDDELLRCASQAQRAADTVIAKFVYDNSSRTKHGPGAVSERYSTSKFEFPSWNYRLEKFFPFDIYGLINHSYLGKEELDSFRADVPSKLIAVPKDYKGPRLIASEPIAAQFVQQAIKSDLRRNVKRSFLRHSIDFLSQEPSRIGAISASLKGDRSTIDLSSASDRLGCHVVECFFRGKYSYMEILNAARTPNVLLPNGEVLNCNKFAAQGAAFTFPVQSIVYALCGIGVELAQNPSMRMADAARKVRVFGDDIIIPQSSFLLLCSLLTSLDMVVNQSKSFSQGLFRESCGADAYGGTDVTPTYVRRLFQRKNPTHTWSTVDSCNNLYLKGYFHASADLLDHIPWDIRKDIPFVSVGSQVWGIRGPNIWAAKTRWSRNLQRLEARCISIMDISRKLPPDGAERLFHWFIEEPGADRVFNPYRVIGRRMKFSVDWVPLSLLG